MRKLKKKQVTSELESRSKSERREERETKIIKYKQSKREIREEEKTVIG